MDIEILITGWGNRKQLAESLKMLAKDIAKKEIESDVKLGRTTWEDPNICATISKLIPEDETE